MRAIKYLLAAAVLFICSAGSASAALVPPPGYYAAVGHKDKSPSCSPPPAPFTGTLDFPSKYEGSGKSRDTLNEESDQRYKMLAKPMSDMEKGASKRVDQYMDSGSPEALQCVLSWYGSWADAHALLGPSVGYSGKAVRKWTLASLSGAWLRLKFSKSQPLAAYPDQQKKIETWLGQVADVVVTEWDLGSPAQKINNHFYWAGWAIMATSVVLDRRDLFDWATRVYGSFASAATADGFLPNELARKTRALGYQNFAIAPVAMMAAFGKANGVDLASRGNGALQRVAERTVQGADDPQLFEAKSASRQVTDGFDGDDQRSKLAWLEPYCWTVACSGPTAQKLAALRPANYTRLGGDVTALFSAAP
jgi:poly(beta-D-mannuronate) lyase